MSLRPSPGWVSIITPESRTIAAGDQRRRADLVGAADAPGGEQRDRQPEEVDQRREPVALEEDDRRCRGSAPSSAGRTRRRAAAGR